MRSKDVDDQGDFNIEMLKRIYTHYENYMAKENLLDFAELILKSYELIKTNKTIRELYRKKFKHILIDEFQDTNSLQFKWIKNLIDPATTIAAVGDDDQSIYGWRGAKIENINKFAKEKGTQIVRLEQNYRSTANILNAANAVIGQNSNRLGKKLWTKGNEGDKIEVFEAYNEEEEANFISENAHSIFSAGDHYKDMAVLYRSNAQSRTVEEALLRQNIPYVIYGGVRFYERLEIKNVLSYLRIIINSNDNNAFERAIGVPSRGVGEKTLTNIRNFAEENNLSLFKSAKQMIAKEIIKGKAGESISKFINFIESLQEELIKASDKNSLFDPPYTTFDLGVIEGGTANNIIPEYTHFNWGYRGLPDEDPYELENKIKSFIREKIEPKLKRVSKDAGVTTELRNETPPLIPDHESAAEHLIRHLTGLNESLSLIHISEPTRPY